MAKRPDPKKKSEPPARKIDYQKRADECASWAASAGNDRARDAFAKMEGFWRKRARNKLAGKSTDKGADAPLVPEEPFKREREREPTR